MLPVAYTGTSLAATCWEHNSYVFIRVYYQAPDMTIKEHRYDSKAWDKGE